MFNVDLHSAVGGCRLTHSIRITEWKIVKKYSNLLDNAKLQRILYQVILLPRLCVRITLFNHFTNTLHFLIFSLDNYVVSQVLSYFSINLHFPNFYLVEHLLLYLLALYISTYVKHVLFQFYYFDKNCICLKYTI